MRISRRVSHVLLGAALGGALGGLALAGPPPGQWPYVGGDGTNSGVAQSLIDSSNARSLRLRWSFRANVIDQLPGRPFGVGEGLAAQPTVKDGMLYVASNAGIIRAFDIGACGRAGASCTPRWTLAIPGANFTTSPTLHRKRLYIASGPSGNDGTVADLVAHVNATPPRISRMFCVDAEEGEVLWAMPLIPDLVTPDGWVVEIRNEAGAPLNRLVYPGEAIVFDELVIVGIASYENRYAGNLASTGSVVAFNRNTGRERWRFWTTTRQWDDWGRLLTHAPPPAGYDPAVGACFQPVMAGGPAPYGAGGGVWSSPALDERSGILYIGTGNAYEYPASPYTSALIALDAKRGELLWHRQVALGDIWNPRDPANPLPPGAVVGTDYRNGCDFDVGAHPNLITLRGEGDEDGARCRVGRRHLQRDRRGCARSFVGVGGKDGRYYLFEARQRRGATPSPVVTIDLGIGGVFGGFQATSAFKDGVLYMASHYKRDRVTGQRIRGTDANSFNLAASPFFTQVAAVDLGALLETGASYVDLATQYDTGRLDRSYVVWSEQIGGNVFGPLNVTNDLLLISRVDLLAVFTQNLPATGIIEMRRLCDGSVVTQRPLFQIDGRSFAITGTAGFTIVGDAIYSVAGGTPKLLFGDSVLFSLGLP